MAPPLKLLSLKEFFFVFNVQPACGETLWGSFNDSERVINTPWKG